MKYLMLLPCLLLSTSLIASIPPGQWQCIAYDAEEKSFDAFGMNIQQAMLAATSRCQKESHQYKSCKSAQSYCEQGPLSLTGDHCVVSDESGRTWNTTGNDACKTAMELCNNWQYLHGISTQCTVKHT